MTSDNKFGFGTKITVKHEATHFGGNILEIEQGKKTDFTFSRTLNKLVYVLSGKLLVSVLRDGRINTITVDQGASFFVRAGLVHQLEGQSRSIIVEFVENVQQFEEDSYVVMKGTPLTTPAIAALTNVPTAQSAPINTSATEEIQQKETAVEEKPRRRRSKKSKDN